MATLSPIPPEISLRPRQQQAVDSVASRIVVAAGPGSGKTRVLVERIARSVLAGRLTLDRVLAVTFTINAAAEMKWRLATRLPRAEVEAASISTIHSLCAALLREHPVEARVDPAFRVLEEFETDVLKVRTMDELLDQMARSESAEFEEFSRHFNKSMCDTLILAYEEARAQGASFDHAEDLLPADGPGSAQLVRIAKLLVHFHSRYSTEKDRLSALDFDDLEYRAWELLKDDTLAARAGGRFTEILVDEYQDTSRLQAAMIERLVAAGGARLFVAGDPKQSIYAFRGARPENFTEAIRRTRDEGGVVIDLVEDFRSRPEVLATVNEYFGALTDFVDSEYQSLVAGRTFAAAPGPRVEIMHHAGRPDEATAIAKAIASMAAERGGDFGAFAMLFRATTDMPIYEQALAAEGVPYFSETGRGFYNTREVADVTNMLHVLDNDRDDIALAAVLRSPMFGISDDGLYLLASRANAERQAGDRDARLTDAIPQAGAITGIPPRDLFILRQYERVREELDRASERRTVDALIREIAHRTGYQETLAGLPGGIVAAANLRKLAEIARALDASSVGVRSPGEFARAIDHFRADEVREPEARIPESRGAVRLMTMHAAKGLEFPVVVLPDLNRPDRPETRVVDYHTSFRLGCTYDNGEDDSLVPTPSLALIRELKKTRNRKEEERLLFVAMTRAEDNLILSGCAGRYPTKRYQRISALATAQPYQEREAPPTATSAPAATTEPNAVPAIYRADESDYAAAITDIAEFASCPRRYYLGRYTGFSNEAVIVEDEEEGDRSDELSATARGTAVHKRLAGQGAASPEIEELARRFEESDLGRRLLALPGVEKELPILARFEDRFLHGVLDLLSGDTIVDYKTGDRHDELYRLQMLLYALLTGAKELYLFYLDEGDAAKRASRVAVTTATLEEARDAARRFFAAQQTLEFSAVVADHCNRCPFSGKQCREPQKLRTVAQT